MLTCNIILGYQGLLFRDYSKKYLFTTKCILYWLQALLHLQKKLSIAHAFQSNSLIQVFWVGGGGGGGGREAGSIVFICMFMCMLLQVKSVDRNQ